ncbi:bifunctional DNA primase/polymerase, partial [Streptomyces lushanensis]|uniref:bifunctional DNA primase/polymerase n=1 Tax=Streptomyces lushanensis TaxID=1434255 RepID=UPI001FDF072B
MTHHPPSSLLSATLAAAERGWHVFPLRPGDKRPALHGSTACPRTGDCAAGHRKWEDRATTDPARIRRAWSVRPFNIGIATGPSGLLVVDLDMPKANSKKGTPSGATTFRAL